MIELARFLSMAPLPGWQPGEGAHVDIFATKALFASAGYSLFILLEATRLVPALPDGSSSLVLQVELSEFGEQFLRDTPGDGRICLDDLMRPEYLSCPPLLYNITDDLEEWRPYLSDLESVKVSWPFGWAPASTGLVFYSHNEDRQTCLYIAFDPHPGKAPAR